jgi:1-acyl-sn-glycerol-3-phosphate acyltransferase
MLHAGQPIFPDLVTTPHAEIAPPREIRNIYQFLRENAGFSTLDPDSGVIKGGASNAGIHSSYTLSASFKLWKTPWWDYVPSGSELVTVFAVSPVFPLKHIRVLGARFVKIIKPEQWLLWTRGLIVTLLLPMITLLAALLGHLAIACGKTHWAQKIRKPWAKLVLWTYGIKYRVHGVDPEIFSRDAQKYVIAARHTSLLDTFIYPAILPDCTCFIAKIELARLPLISSFFVKTGNIFIDRNNGLGAMRKIIMLSRDKRTKYHFFIHPEGTRQSESIVGEIKKGLVGIARHSMLPVVPMTVVGGSYLWPKKRLFPMPGKIAVHIGAPLEPTSLDENKIKEFYLKFVEEQSFTK